MASTMLSRAESDRLALGTVTATSAAGKPILRAAALVTALLVSPGCVNGEFGPGSAFEAVRQQAVTVEQVFEMTEEFIGSGEKVLIIWDSIANTPTESDKEGGFNPNSSIW